MLHAEGFWNEPNDMLYLSRNEVRDVLFDLVTAGASAPRRRSARTSGRRRSSAAGASSTR